MQKVDLRLALLAAALIAAPAIAQSSALTKLEVVGNHAGRMMMLAIDGKPVFEGRGHLDPPGVAWTLNIAPGEAPAPVELKLESCDAPFKGEVSRDGRVHTLLIQGCEIKLLGG